MAAKQEVQVILSGNAAALYKTLGEASKATQTMAREMEATAGGLKNLFAGFTAPLMAGLAAIGGMEFLKGTIEETKTWTVEAQKLSRILNITTEAASVLNLAIGDIYGTQEEYLGAVAKLTKTLNTNEEAIQKLGVATRDSNGQFRDTPTIMAEVNAALLKIEGGTARNVASAQIYGKSWMEVQRYLKLTPEVMQAAQEKAEKLNLIVGQDAVEATNAYRASMNDLEDTVKALKLRLGNELMPVMTEFNTMAAEHGPTALGALGVGIKLVRGHFETFLLAVKSSFEVLKLGFLESKNLVVTFAKVMEQVKAGNLKGAKDLALKGKEDAKQIFRDFLTETQENAQKLKESITLMWSPKNGAMGPEKPKAKGGMGPAGGDSKEGADPYEAYAAQMAAEAKIRKERLALWELHQNDLFEIFGTEQDREERKINQHYDAMLQHARSFGAEQSILDRIEVEREVVIQNARTEFERKQAEERKRIAEEEAKEARRILEETGTAQQGFLDGIDQYLQRQATTFQQWSQAVERVLQGVENAFARGISGILTGQMTFSQGLRSIWQGVTGAIIQMLAQMVAKWVVASIAAKLFKDTASDAAKENAVAQQEAAASTLWATYSGIPFVGPALAAGFIAMMNASLIANAASAQGIVGAAEGGWFDRPTLTMIGEGKRPELVVPDVAFRDFASNLANNILAQERQAQAYGRQAAGYASGGSSAPGGAGASSVHLEQHFHAPIWDASQRGLRQLGETVVDGLRATTRERSVVLRPGQVFGGL